MNSPDKTTAITTDLAERAMGARRPQYFLDAALRTPDGELRRHALSPVFHVRSRLMLTPRLLVSRHSLSVSTP